MFKRIIGALKSAGAFQTARLCIVTGGYSGLIPIAPGTAGSAVGVFLVWALYPICGISIQIALSIAIGALGIWLSDAAQHHFKRSDPGQIVIDEIAGVFFTMIAIPITGSSLLYGFVLFRIFDIAKPPPAKYFDTRLKNGWGIMMDDIVSGIYANIVLHLIWSTKI